MSVSWHGVFPAVTTKFTPDDTVDHAAMGRHIAWQAESGVDGIIVCGSLGEAGVLDLDEKCAILATAKAAIDLPVIATVAETTTRAAVEFVSRAEAAGADGFMVLPGMQYVADRREVRAHFLAVAGTATTPLMIYNNPVSYRMDLEEDDLAVLAEEPKFVAIKESSDDVRRMTRLRNRFGDRFALFSGVDNLALESLAMGADGWVAGLVCAFPRETVAIYRLAQAGRLEAARALYRWFQPLLDLDVSTKLVQNIKLAEVMAAAPGASETVRAPRLPLAGAERDAVTEIITHALSNRPQLTDI